MDIATTRDPWTILSMRLSNLRMQKLQCLASSNSNSLTSSLLLRCSGKRMHHLQRSPKEFELVKFESRAIEPAQSIETVHHEVLLLEVSCQYWSAGGLASPSHFHVTWREGSWGGHSSGRSVFFCGTESSQFNKPQTLIRWWTCFEDPSGANSIVSSTGGACNEWAPRINSTTGYKCSL